MKKFHFPLERVLAWRRTQLKMEQTKLEQLVHELKIVDVRTASVQKALDESRNNIVRSQSKLGMELESYDGFRTASEAQTISLAQARRVCLDKIATQRSVVQEKERDVKLLEKLREDKLSAWRTDQSREVDQQAEESYLARWTK